MPNYCGNYVEIHTKKENKKLILNKEGKFSLMNICPLNKKKEWEYYKAIEKWGTKWDVVDTTHDIRDEGDDESCIICISFDSAWSPPIGALNCLYKKLIKKDKNATVQCWYYEPGVGFVGYWCDGEVEYYGSEEWICDDEDDYTYVCSNERVKELLREHEENVYSVQEVMLDKNLKHLRKLAKELLSSKK